MRWICDICLVIRVGDGPLIQSKQDRRIPVGSGSSHLPVHHMCVESSFAIRINRISHQSMS